MTERVFAYVKTFANATVIPYTLEQWARDTLSSEEFANYEASQIRQNAIVGAAVASNVITETPITAPMDIPEVVDGVPTGNTVTEVREIGVKYGNIEELPTPDPEWVSFWDRFIVDLNNDPFVSPVE